MDFSVVDISASTWICARKIPYSSVNWATYTIRVYIQTVEMYHTEKPREMWNAVSVCQCHLYTFYTQFTQTRMGNGEVCFIWITANLNGNRHTTSPYHKLRSLTNTLDAKLLKFMNCIVFEISINLASIFKIKSIRYSFVCFTVVHKHHYGQSSIENSLKPNQIK